MKKAIFIITLCMFTKLTYSQITGGEIQTPNETPETEKTKLITKKQEKLKYGIISVSNYNLSTLKELPRTKNNEEFKEDILDGKFGLKSMSSFSLTSGKILKFNLPEILKIGLDFTYLDFGYGFFNEETEYDESLLLSFSMGLSPYIAYNPVDQLYIGVKYALTPTFLTTIVDTYFTNSNVNINVFNTGLVVNRHSFGLFLRYNVLYLEMNTTSGSKEMEIEIFEDGNIREDKISFDLSSTVFTFGLCF